MSTNTIDPLSTQGFRLTVTDARTPGVPVTTATVTATVRRVEGETAYAGLVDIEMPHVTNGRYEGLVSPAQWLTAGITPETEGVLVDFTVVIPGNPQVVDVVRRPAAVRRKVQA